MTALFIILAIAALITAILCLTAGVFVKFDDDGLNVKLCVGPLKITMLPQKKRKKRIGKLSRKLRGKRISDIVFEEDKPEKKKKKNKEKRKLKFERTGNTIADFISAVSEMTDEPETLRLMLTALKNLAADFKKTLIIRIDSLKAEIDTGDAGKTCICCAAISASLECFLELAKNFTNLHPIKDGSVGVFPSFGTGCRFDIRFTVKMRTFSVLKAIVSSAVENMKIQKQIITPKERNTK